MQQTLCKTQTKTKKNLVIEGVGSGAKKGVPRLSLKPRAPPVKFHFKARHWWVGQSGGADEEPQLTTDPNPRGLQRTSRVSEFFEEQMPICLGRCTGMSLPPCPVKGSVGASFLGGGWIGTLKVTSCHHYPNPCSMSNGCAFLPWYLAMLPVVWREAQVCANLLNRFVLCLLKEFCDCRPDNCRFLWLLSQLHSSPPPPHSCSALSRLVRLRVCRTAPGLSRHRDHGRRRSGSAAMHFAGAWKWGQVRRGAVQKAFGPGPTPRPHPPPPAPGCPAQ